MEGEAEDAFEVSLEFGQGALDEGHVHFFCPVPGCGYEFCTSCDVAWTKHAGMTCEEFQTFMKDQVERAALEETAPVNGQKDKVDESNKDNVITTAELDAELTQFFDQGFF